jgi:hypothetical protein
MLGKVHKVLISDPFLEGVAHSRGGVRMIKRIIRSLTVTALVVLALAVPAFAQEEIPCRNANGDESIRCDGKLYVPYNEAYGYYDEQTPWGDYGDEDYGYPPFGYGDEDYGYPPFGYGDEDYEYPPFGYGDDYSYYDDDVQEAWDEFVEEWEESVDY